MLIYRQPESDWGGVHNLAAGGSSDAVFAHRVAVRIDWNICSTRKLAIDRGVAGTDGVCDTPVRHRLARGVIMDQLRKFPQSPTLLLFACAFHALNPVGQQHHRGLDVVVVIVAVHDLRHHIGIELEDTGHRSEPVHQFASSGAR